MRVLQAGYPGYDTSVGWFQYSDEKICDNAKRAVDAGFTAMKLKVGSPDAERDVRRAHLVREGAPALPRGEMGGNEQSGDSR